MCDAGEERALVERNKIFGKARQRKWNTEKNQLNKRSTTLSECVFLALGNQRAMRMRYIVVCSLSDCTIFFHFISRAVPFLNEVTEHKMCVLIFSTNFFWNIFHSKKNSTMYYHIQTSSCEAPCYLAIYYHIQTSPCEAPCYSAVYYHIQTSLCEAPCYSAIYYHIQTSLCEAPCCSCQILMKLEFSRRTFAKFSVIWFLENPFSGSRGVPCGRTDGETWRSC
jgi:hypothetical protein